MIAPLSIDRYPAQTVEGMIARLFVNSIVACEDFTIALEPIQEVIAQSRAMMRKAGWPVIYEHNFLIQLRNDLTELTRAHPVTRQFYTLLTIETEF